MEFDRPTPVSHCLGMIPGLPCRQGETIPCIGIIRIGPDHEPEQGIGGAETALSECYISKANLRVEIAGTETISLREALARLGYRIGAKKRVPLGDEGARARRTRCLGHTGFPEARKGERDDPRERYPV